VADKQRTKKKMKELQHIKIWQLIVLFILSAFLAAVFLKLNNIGMVERRAALLAADETGNNEAIINKLYDLQRYVSDHMNTDMGKGIYLEASYKRDYQEALDSAYQDKGLTRGTNKKEQEVCVSQFNQCFYVDISCTSDGLTQCSVVNDVMSTVQKPNIDSYFYVFAPPLWSSDYAGWSVVACAVICLLIVARFLSFCILKIVINHRYKSI
jgi:hypothetical protein